jgi:hypothetical protein
MSVVVRRRSVASQARPRFLAVAGALAVLVLAPAGAAVADPPDFSLTVGVPIRSNGPAVIDNRLTAGGGQVLSEQQLGLGDPSDYSHSRFGTAMLIEDLDDDGWDDLIVGAPGVSDAGTGAPGSVYLLFGTSTGISAARALTLPAHAVDGDEFGSALSLTFRTSDDDSAPRIRDLWIGAPGHDVDGRVNAGAVFRYTLDATGTPTFVETITQDTPLVTGTAEANDRFGEVLAARAGNGTVVGVPRENIGSAVDAGTVQQLRIDPTDGRLIAGRDWGQNAAGVAGTAEAGDRFGASMTAYAAVVGAPGEDLGRIKDAGSVQLFNWSQDQVLVPAGTYTQDSPGVPGRAEAWDWFGAAVGHGVYQCELGDSAAIGAPGEDVGSVRDAGSVTLALIPRPGAALKDCPAQVFSQGHGLPGTAEANDELGAALGELPGDLNDEEALRDIVLVGVPGEDIGTTASGRDAGQVIVGAGSISRTPQSYGFQGGDVNGLHFGSYFPSR